MSLKKSLSKVFSANFFQIISSTIVGLIVPAILSIDGYADYKTYTLIVTYLGLLSFGFADGLYIKYGGKKYNELNMSVFKNEFFSFIIMETLIFAVFIVFSVFMKNPILMCVSLTILPFMVTSFFKTIYQATSNFSRYSRIIYIYSFSYALLNIIVALIFRNTNYIVYCLITACANIISSAYCIYYLTKDFSKTSKFHFSEKNYSSIKVGFFILLGNLAFMLFFGIDRWMVKLFMNNSDFAYYSFAVNLLNIIIVLINAISITFYSYLFDKKNMDKINDIKDILILIGGFASLVSFGLKIIINLLLKKYIPSLDIISNTFATFPYMVIINSLYVNLYKIQKQEKKYFFVIVSMMLVSFLYNVIALLLFGTTFAISIATLLAFITWFLYSYFDLKKIQLSLANIITLVSLTSGFLLFSHISNLLLGGCLYCALLVILILLFYKDKMIFLKNFFIEIS